MRHSFGNLTTITQKVLAELAQAEQALEAAFERWEYLEVSKERRLNRE